MKVTPEEHDGRVDIAEQLIRRVEAKVTTPGGLSRRDMISLAMHLDHALIRAQRLENCAAILKDFEDAALRVGVEVSRGVTMTDALTSEQTPFCLKAE